MTNIHRRRRETAIKVRNFMNEFLQNESYVRTGFTDNNKEEESTTVAVIERIQLTLEPQRFGFIELRIFRRLRKNKIFKCHQLLFGE